LAGTFVSELKGRTGGVQTIHMHAFPRCVQPELRSFTFMVIVQIISCRLAQWEPESRYKYRPTVFARAFSFAGHPVVSSC
jgi:hypothetical protein